MFNQTKKTIFLLHLPNCSLKRSRECSLSTAVERSCHPIKKLYVVLQITEPLEPKVEEEVELSCPTIREENNNFQLMLDGSENLRNSTIEERAEYQNTSTDVLLWFCLCAPLLLR